MREPRFRLLDRVLARRNRLPLRVGYSVADNNVTVDDGTVLKVAHYAPAGPAKGTLVAMTPYGRIGLTSTILFGPYASQGYHVVAASIRGSFGSEGTFDPMFHEGADFRDVVEWIRGQSWYTGSFASLGASYLGWTQWALLSDLQPDHKAAVITVGPHDFKDFHWGEGTFTSSFPMWVALVSATNEGALRSVRYALTRGKPIYDLLHRAPVSRALHAAIPSDTRWADSRFAHGIDDPYWAPVDFADALDRTTVPILIASGWQDIFLRQSIEQFTRLRSRGVDAAITVGPWAHTAMNDPMHVHETLEWLDAHLTRTGPARASRVHLFVTGADEWRTHDQWPPVTTTRRLHLATDAFTDAPATGDVSIDFDPRDQPVFPGGPLLMGGGYADDTDVADRDDVFAVASAPLDMDLEVQGTAAVVVDHSSERDDTNIFVRLSDLDERGRSRNVTQGAARVRGDGTVRIELDPAAHRFLAGHSIRLAVAGGAHPHFPPNPGTGENPMFAVHRVRNRITIRLPGSYVDLPVAARTPDHFKEIP